MTEEIKQPEVAVATEVVLPEVPEVKEIKVEETKVPEVKIPEVPTDNSANIAPEQNKTQEAGEIKSSLADAPANEQNSTDEAASASEAAESSTTEESEDESYETEGKLDPKKIYDEKGDVKDPFNLELRDKINKNFIDQVPGKLRF